jgi:hypothetical protein
MHFLFQGFPKTAVFVAFSASLGICYAQQNTAPRIVVPTGKPTLPVNQAQAARSPYPWKTHITATIFWCGEPPEGRNRTPNYKSSWDTEWRENFGGFDDPSPENRIANHATGEFRPKAFVPKLNPFYIALPYNDVVSGAKHKPEAARVIPWFASFQPAPGKTVLKGRWVQIYQNKRSCYAQWEDCGPWVTDDWQYVFGKSSPKTKENGAAGIDLSPAIRDYLGVQSGHKVHWRFVEDHQVPYGPWKKYGVQTPAPKLPVGSVTKRPSETDSIEVQRAYMEHLRKLRDEEYKKRPLSEL